MLITQIKVRSVLNCATKHGVCQKCYGYNLGTHKLVETGVAVGVIAAQSMGEAATQLTLNTKHLAGRAGTDITQGLPRVEELFEVRTPKAKAILTEMDGTVKFIKDDEGKVVMIKIQNRKKMQKNFELQEGDKANVKRSKNVKKGEVIYTKANGEEIVAELEGVVSINDNKILFLVDKELEVEYTISATDSLVVEEGDNVIKGDALTMGSKDPKEIMTYSNLLAAQEYLIDNIQETYGIQGIGIDDKHVEVVVRQMSRLERILDPGDSSYYLETSLITW
jgi:DNA-directed RNA polymerase subunit beta'